MQHSFFLKENTKWHYLLLAIIACIVFWPLTLGIFSLKNDAYIFFLPWRYHISEAIQQGEFPFWSPYLYTGLPLHSDMQSGTWNPIVLLISLVTRYNMQVLEWELLFYIILAGIGMYKLTRETGHLPLTSFLAGVSYMCCGFFTDSGSFIPWITSAAWLPFVFLYLIRLLKHPGIKNSIRLGLLLFLTLTAGYPSFFIYAGYILLAACIYWIILHRSEKKRLLQCIKYLTGSLLLLVLLSLPAILSFYDFLPYYQRGSGATIEQALTDPFSPFAVISYLLPSAGVKPHAWFSADIAMRNASIGLFGLAFFLVSLTSRFTAVQKFIAAATLFSFLFSLGDATPLRKWCYEVLPFMNSFRHPGIIRLFTSIGLILLAAKSIDLFFTERKQITKKIRIVLLAIGGILAGLVTYYALSGFHFKHIFPAGQNLKIYIDTLSFADIAVIQGILQLLFLVSFLLFIRNRKATVILIVFNAIVFAWMALPFTFVSQVRTKTIDNFINSFPKGFPMPDINDPADPAGRPSYDPYSVYSFYFFYDKKITVHETIISPTLPGAYSSYLSKRSLQDSLHPASFAFVSTSGEQVDSNATVIPEKFSPSSFTFRTITGKPGYLNIVQQYHHNWHATVNDNPAKIEKANTAFMRVKIPAGDSITSIKYSPGKIIWLAMYLSAITALAVIIHLIYVYWKIFRPAKKH